MQPYEKYLKENSQKLRVDQTEKPANVMFTGFSQYILQNFSSSIHNKKTCPFGQVFNNDGLQAAQTGSIVCNHQFFVGRNHNGNSFAVGSGNHTGIAETGFQVGFLVNVQAEEAQVAQYTFADDVRSFRRYRR